MNAVEIEQALSDLAEQPFDAAEFPYAFLAAFGNKETTLKRLKSGNSNLRAAHVRNDVVLHRPPLQERYRVAGKTVCPLHPNDNQDGRHVARKEGCAEEGVSKSTLPSFAIPCGKVT